MCKSYKHPAQILREAVPNHVAVVARAHDRPNLLVLVFKPPSRQGVQWPPIFDGLLIMLG